MLETVWLISGLIRLSHVDRVLVLSYDTILVADWSLSGLSHLRLVCICFIESVLSDSVASRDLSHDLLHVNVSCMSALLLGQPIFNSLGLLESCDSISCSDW